MLVSTVMASR